MLSSKNKGLFVEKSRFRVMVAVTSSAQAPLLVERIADMSPEAGKEQVRDFILALAQGGKNLRFAPCRACVYPSARFFNRHSADIPIKLKEPGHFEDLLRNQMGVDLTIYNVAVLGASDGLPFDPARNLSAQRELILAGAPLEQLRAEQEELLSMGIFPERMELGSLSSAASLMNYMRFAGIKRPVLYLEIGMTGSFLFIVTPERMDLCRSIPHGLDSMLPALGTELGVKDEQSARNLLFSNTFDFTEMGPALLGKLLREMRASTGFYEVQTGQSIGHVVVNLIPPNLDWIRLCISRSLGMDLLKFDFRAWLASNGVQVSDSVDMTALSQSWIGALGLLSDYELPPAA
ncbi:MAG: hypothetical protein WC360_03330 [Opitutales bacterium]